MIQKNQKKNNNAKNIIIKQCQQIRDLLLFFYKCLQSAKKLIFLNRFYNRIYLQYQIISIFKQHSIVNKQFYRIVIEIAQSLNQTIQFEQHQYQSEPQGYQPFELVVSQNQDSNNFLSLEDTKRRQFILKEQIKSEVALRLRNIRYMQYFNALVNQILIIWDFCLQMIMEPLDVCYSNLATFQMIFLLIQLYQYGEEYILCLIVLISLPLRVLMIL
ncbi:unnamed protein product [Paramecium pentaurelia]|uniref:Transmembrane protein n=1 Tax=Paramecium pentaurelia TaxID=43138 RepID=A0A8S1TNV0_9CILI|nr:unnamed protein product [Paramecium pentaurelia]